MSGRDVPLVWCNLIDDSRRTFIGILGIAFAAILMFMQLGFAMVETGFTRSKNAVNTMAMNLIIYPIGIIGFWLTGYGFMMGGVAHWPSLGSAAIGHHELSITIGAHSSSRSSTSTRSGATASSFCALSSRPGHPSTSPLVSTSTWANPCARARSVIRRVASTTPRMSRAG